MGNEEINKFNKGLLWSLFIFIPIIGSFIYIYKVVDAGMGSKNAFRWLTIYILLFIIYAVLIYHPNDLFPIIGSFLALAGSITLCIITVKSIGWRFFAGSLIVQVLVYGIFIFL